VAKDTEAAKTDDGKRSITVRLLPELYGEIEKQALDDERTISQFVERHLRKHFGTNKVPGEKIAV